MNIFKKNLTLIATVFAKLGTRTEALRSVSKKCCFTVPFNKQHDKGAQNTFQIITVAPLSYLLITEKDIEFEKVTLSDMQNVMTVC